MSNRDVHHPNPAHLEMPIPYGDEGRYWRVIGANGEPISRCGEGLADDDTVEHNALLTLEALLIGLPVDKVTPVVKRWLAR